ncbi:uncharacterized protein LOC119077443 isoform X2 [Bradysia coprophila]|uniref:uncharacterized protein LOC119077443 isoform X2 n=1 Tax=Bradysia coprophila TaxID=38358 RepID=UPI00187DCBBA|nr:uncharacterized protein LOC119077443 isoform X2 [Bradysia coprophila]
MSSAKVNGNKYCAFEQDGEAKYYVCQMRNEYCCRLGCCVNLAFQFYQMWYYWLLLIFMFMLCSGGGWWYRFCRQPSNVSSYTMATAAAQHVPERQYQRRTTHEQNHRRQRLVQAMQHSRVLMNDPSMNVVWKNMTNSPPPNYYSSSNTYYHANNSQAAPNYHPSVQQLQCPYYQLYGPPPSYDSVVQISNSSVQPTCVLVTSTIPCSFITPTTANAALNDASNNTPSSSAADGTASSANAISQPNDFEQPSTSSNIPNNAPSIERRYETRRKSGTGSV